MNALGLCDLFIFVWWQDRQSEDLELLVVLATGPSLERVCVFLHLLTRPDAKACSHMCLCGLQPSVAAKQRQAVLHPSALSLSWCYTELGQASKTGCERVLLLTGSHTCGSKQLYMF